MSRNKVLMRLRKQRSRYRRVSKLVLFSKTIILKRAYPRKGKIKKRLHIEKRRNPVPLDQARIFDALTKIIHEPEETLKDINRISRMGER